MEGASLESRTQGFGENEVVKKKEKILAAVLLSQAIAFLIALTSVTSTVLASKVRLSITVGISGLVAL